MNHATRYKLPWQQANTYNNQPGVLKLKLKNGVIINNRYSLIYFMYQKSSVY